MLNWNFTVLELLLLMFWAAKLELVVDGACIADFRRHVQEVRRL